MLVQNAPSHLPDVADQDHDYIDQIFVAAGTIVALDWVMVDITATTHGRGRSVIQGAVANPTRWVGIALHAAVSGEAVRVRRSGIVAGANVADAVAAGDPLTVGAAAGRADVGTVGTHHILGFALTAGDASNDADVFVNCL
jgi:hypothetical protein